MNSDLIKARSLLKNGVYTCVLCKGEEIITSSQRGVKPLVEWIENHKNTIGFSAADKVVGKAAALLYVLLGVKEVYAPVMSEGAIHILEKYDIPPIYDISVKGIMNRMGTGICPMEQAVEGIETPKQALEEIKITLLRLQNQN